ncbi:hypothetical protein COO60DRAFT_753020 [Scenedesmus sp. NREL 46B-D3]|nr:hypothetical protein COO60DRAFT_753020 [Scenedesmus sp. NREL 46B-D3]
MRCLFDWWLVQMVQLSLTIPLCAKYKSVIVAVERSHLLVCSCTLLLRMFKSSLACRVCNHLHQLRKNVATIFSCAITCTVAHCK